MYRQLLCITLLWASTPLFAHAADYTIDTRGAHASIQFKIQHLGYSWLKGRFNQFEGRFSYDARHPEKSSVEVDIDVTSIDSNHSERDEHLRGAKFLNTDEFPSARFVSHSFTPAADGDSATLSGDFTLHGVTRPITITVTKIGEGHDPWGGYRAGFSGITEIKLEDFGIKNILGPASETVYLELEVEGVRRKSLRPK